MPVSLAVVLLLALAGSPTRAEDAPRWSSPLALGPSDVTSIAARPGLVLAGGKAHEKDATPSGVETVPSPRVAGIFRSTDLGASWSRGRQPIVRPDGQTELRTIEETPLLVALPATGSDAYALFGAKVWRSEDDAQTWRPVGEVGNSASTLEVLADGRLVAGLVTGGLRVSADRGATWTPLGTGLPSARVHEVHPHSATVLLVATDQGLYRSADGGGSFTQVTTGLAQPGAAALGVTGFNSSPLFLAMPGSVLTSTAIYTSTDGGATWTPRVSPFGQNLLPRVHPGSLEVVVHSSVYRLFAGTPTGLYRSGTRTSAGLEWDRIDPEPGTSPVRELAAVDTDPGNLTSHALFAALDRASPAVVTATETRLAAPGWMDEAEGGRICGGLVPRSDGALFAACGRHVFRSNDGGQTWAGAGSGLPYISIGISDTPYNPLVAGADGSLWTSGFHYGLYHSNAAVTQWTKVPIPAASVGAIGTHPTDPNVVFAAGLLTNGATGILWKTTDGGTTWRPTLDTGTAIYNISVDPSNPNRVLVAAFNRGAYLSQDGGATWAAPAGLVGTVYRTFYSAAKPGRAYALVQGGTGEDPESHIYRSDNGGANWDFINRIETPTASGGLRARFAFELEISPWDAETMYAPLTDGDLLVSRDGGFTWEALDDGLPKKPGCSICEDIQNLTFDRSTPGRLYITAGIMGGGAEPHSYWVYRSDDPGA